ncbi:MAG: signal peptidase II [Thermodesulfobacteriota bacterium]|nr:signal peptidase II [Thermodesulfobacteriota bacterium]
MVAFSGKKYSTFFLFAGIIVVLDQVTKAIVVHAFSLHESLVVIPGLFSLVHIRNTGGAFGLLAGDATGMRTLFFLAISVLALVIILIFYSRVTPGKPWIGGAFAMIFGGALGNLIDRLRFGEVVDFLDFYIGNTHWPAFNIADSAISVGAGTLFVLALMRKV